MILVHSSNGNLYFNKRGRLDRVTGDWDVAGLPVQLDLSEWEITYPYNKAHDSEHDILDWAFWTVGGVYAKAERK